MKSLKETGVTAHDAFFGALPREELARDRDAFTRALT
jgi:hypothetical protein